MSGPARHLSRHAAAIALTVPALICAALAVGGCGSGRVHAPDLAATARPAGFETIRYPADGVALTVPSDWSVTTETPPLIALYSSGTATISLWRFPTAGSARGARGARAARARVGVGAVTSSAQLEGALRALVRAAKATDPGMVVQRTGVSSVAGRGAVIIDADEQIGGKLRRVRSEHVYVPGAELVLDAYAPPAQFSAVDHDVFSPVRKSLTLLNGGRATGGGDVDRDLHSDADAEDRGVSVRRAFVVVIDACGAGALPDAADYGDAGTNTLTHLAEQVGGLDLPVLGGLGLGNITAIAGVDPVPAPVAHGRLAAIGPGKDSTAGHWGLMGVASDEPLPTYPDGFPPAVLALVQRASGRGILANHPADGVAVIEDYGAAHLAGGELIVYTSADSVLQIAAHDRVLSAEALHGICAAVRSQLPPEHAVGRVIARPFSGEPDAFTRTTGRKDFALAPPGRSYLEEIQAAGFPVHTVGKTGQLMAGVGVDVEHPGSTNAMALAETGELIDALPAGLVFTNLVETDQLYGHRHDTAGFAGALADIDAHVGGWLARLGAEDLLIITADHGVDPLSPRHDHTREYAPLLAVFAGSCGRHDGLLADVGASALAWLSGGAEVAGLPGESFLPCLSCPKSRRSGASWPPTSKGAPSSRSRSSIPAGRCPSRPPRSPAS